MSYSVQSVNREFVYQTGTKGRIQRGTENFSNIRYSSGLKDKEIMLASYWREGRQDLERFSLVMLWWSLQLGVKVHACSCGVCV